MFGWGGRPSRNLPTVDYNEDTSSDEDLPFVSPKRPAVTRAGSPELLAVPQLSDNVDEDLEQVSQTLKNIGHTKLFRQTSNSNKGEEIVEGHVVGFPANTNLKAGPPAVIMAEAFEGENGTDTEKAIDKITKLEGEIAILNKGRYVQCFVQEDKKQ